MDAAPVIGRGHNVVVFVPPVAEAALPSIRAATRRPALILTADAFHAAELAEALGGFAATGFERAKQRLVNGAEPVVACGIEDALALLGRSALQPGGFPCLVLAWPEQFDADGEAALASVLAECDKDAQRIILTGRTGAATDALIDRYAFKAMTFGFPGADAAPAAPVGPARYLVGSPHQVADLRRRVLDALHPERDDAVVVATCPASREAAQALLAGGGEPPVIVAEAHQLGWLRSLFSPLSPLHLPGGADLADQRAEKLRARIAHTIDTEDLDRELLTIAPLLSRYDPALVAAAALRLSGSANPSAGREAAPPPAAVGASTTAKIWVGIGRKDGAKPGDLVGAIVNEAAVPADAIGKIDVRDLFCLVEIRADLAPQVVKGLTGRTLRGRRLVARVDRGPGAGAKPPRRV